MKNKTFGINRRSLMLWFLLPTVTSLAGCMGGSSPPEITPSQAVLSPGQSLRFRVHGRKGARLWSVNGLLQGSSTAGTISIHGLFTAPAITDPASVNPAIRVGVVVNGAPSFPVLVSLFLPGKFAPGTVSPTANPLVASYSIVAPEGASIQVQFGPDTNYGLTTWSQPAPAQGGAVHILVAGMRASSIYHMRAIIQFEDGTQAVDTDHIFTTGTVPANRLPNMAVNQFGGLAPRSGIELLALVYPGTGNQLTAVATDLSGNVIWYYDMGPGEWPFPIKPLPNGHMLVVANGNNTSEVREIDLAGTVINRISQNELNSGLTSMGFSLQAVAFHHDILQLPNGHLIFLVQCTKNLNIPGLAPGTPIIGDAIVDWDTKQQLPVWTWSTFDYIDISHAPFGYPDWTHANALAYSPDDGNLILSMRNQNWVAKIDYRDGAGDGAILWRLGPGGDFTLPTAEAPIEWNYGQHYPTLLGPNTAGIYPVMFFNNGNNRLVDSNGTICNSPGAVSCYSSVPIVELNEYTKTAQILWEDKLSAYSICCGNASLLPNDHVEFDVAFDQHTPGVSYIQEVTQEQNPQLLWQMNIAGQLAYRGFRIPSLYPGVQW